MQVIIVSHHWSKEGTIIWWRYPSPALCVGTAHVQVVVAPLHMALSWPAVSKQNTCQKHQQPLKVATQREEYNTKGLVSSGQSICGSVSKCWSSLWLLHSITDSQMPQGSAEEGRRHTHCGMPTPWSIIYTAGVALAVATDIYCKTATAVCNLRLLEEQPPSGGNSWKRTRTMTKDWMPMRRLTLMEEWMEDQYPWKRGWPNKD